MKNKISRIKQEIFSKKTIDFFTIYFRFSIAFLIAQLILRAFEFISITVPYSFITATLIGYITDILLYLKLTGIILIPLVILANINLKIAKITFIALLYILNFSSILLTLYYIRALAPLDQVIFYYSAPEIIKIINTSGGFNMTAIISIIVLMVPILYFVIKPFRFKVAKTIAYICLILMLAAVIRIHFNMPKPEWFQNPVKYQMASNKLFYFANKTAIYSSELLNHAKDNDQKIKEEIAKYQQTFNDRQYLSTEYPFLFNDTLKTGSLTPLFYLSKQRPNIVIIIVESLGRRYCGPDAELGSFTPFLDSLIGESLFWENTLSTSERTINALPSVLGSLPYGRVGFAAISNDVDHYSLLSLLKKNGYKVNFFYGSDVGFDNMKLFIRKQGIDIFSHDDFYTAADGTIYWGINDGELFKRSMINLNKQNYSPRVDIYLTLSTHGPYDFPNYKGYMSIANKLIIKYNQPNDNIKNKELTSVLSSVLYTDATLKSFFDNYKERHDFANTIFVITGDHAHDHAIPQNRIDFFRVPLIIYSPLLKGHRKFSSVVSHLDITPSILKLLSNQYDIEIPKQNHWLGNQLDTSHEFHLNRKLFFLNLGREINECLINSYFWSGDQLFKINPGMKIEPIKSKIISDQMVSKLDNFKSLNKYVCRNNKLISPALFLKTFTK